MPCGLRSALGARRKSRRRGDAELSARPRGFARCQPAGGTARGGGAGAGSPAPAGNFPQLGTAGPRRRLGPRDGERRPAGGSGGGGSGRHLPGAAPLRSRDPPGAQRSPAPRPPRPRAAPGGLRGAPPRRAVPGLRGRRRGRSARSVPGPGTCGARREDERGRGAQGETGAAEEAGGADAGGERDRAVGTEFADILKRDKISSFLFFPS